MLSRIENILYGFNRSNVNDIASKENETDQKIRMVVKIILWGAIGAMACLIPGLSMVGQPGLYWNITVLGQEVWKMIIPPAISMLIGASVGSVFAYSSIHKNPDAGIFKL